jgi:hypothetical protein
VVACVLVGIAGPYPEYKDMRVLILILKPLRKAGYYVRIGRAEFSLASRSYFDHVKAESINIT